MSNCLRYAVFLNSCLHQDQNKNYTLQLVAMLFKSFTVYRDPLQFFLICILNVGGKNLGADYIPVVSLHMFISHLYFH